MSTSMLGWILFGGTICYLAGVVTVLIIGHKYNLRKKAEKHGG